jgi:hypothetical protein
MMTGRPTSLTRDPKPQTCGHGHALAASSKRHGRGDYASHQYGLRWLGIRGYDGQRI